MEGLQEPLPPNFGDSPLKMCSPTALSRVTRQVRGPSCTRVRLVMSVFWGKLGFFGKFWGFGGRFRLFGGNLRESGEVWG